MIENDPGAPKVQAGPWDKAVAQDFDRLKQYAKPAPLAAGAVVEDWPHFLGARYDLASRDNSVRTTWDAANPPKLLWEVQRGKAAAPPVISGGKLVMSHRLGNLETVECLDAETGQRFWIAQYPVDYGQSFGYPEAPQAPPTIEGDAVYVMGTRALMRSYDLASGAVRWERDLGAEMGVDTGFFGKGGAPLIHGDDVILNLGGRQDYCVAAFEKTTGKLRWVTHGPWDGSYASPIPATIHGRDRVLVFAGGKVDQTKGGLVCVDPQDGTEDFSFPWRSSRAPNVNASTPRIVGNRVFLTEAYFGGSVLVDLQPKGEPEVFAKLPNIRVQFMTPLVRENRYLYGITEKSQMGASLFCLDMQTGKELWRDLRIGRGNLLATADGVFATGETGQFLSLELTPAGVKVLAEFEPFKAPETFCPPTIYHGLLYLVQSSPEPGGTTKERLLCFDLRR